MFMQDKNRKLIKEGTWFLDDAARDGYRSCLIVELVYVCVILL